MDTIKLTRGEKSFIESDITEGSLEESDLQGDYLVISEDVKAHIDGWIDRLNYWAGEKDEFYRKYRKYSNRIWNKICLAEHAS